MINNFNPNDLTVVVGIAGIVASAVLSYAFYLVGRRSEVTARAELTDQITTLRSVVTAYLDDKVADYRARSGGLTGQGQDPGASGAPDLARVPQARTPAQATDDVADDAVKAVVHGYLALLVNHKGEVDMSALLRQVSEALGARRGLIWSALSQLRAEDVISTDPPGDVRSARVVRVNPVPQRDISTNDLP